MTDLPGLLACPRCDAPLDELRCPACRVSFPVLDGVPWLFADPKAAVADWKNRWRLARERLDQDLARTRRALKQPGRPATRQRLETLARGYEAQCRHLETLLEPLDLAQGGSLETLLALRTRLPPSQGIFSYDGNVHRDWAWGDEENAASLDAVLEVLEVLEPAAPQRILVLGAGAGRLAYDLHQASGAACTVAVDLNPLLAAVCHRVARGETVPLVEFPLAPRTPETAAVERSLTAPEPAREGFHVLLADVLRPPFRPACFDLVVTPWLLDVMDEPAGTVLPRVNALLRPGGLWLNHGSIAFDHPDPAERLTLDELVALAGETGFDDARVRERRQPYLACPDSRHGRVESVVTLGARKARAAPACKRAQRLPDWIAQGRTPIPPLPAFQTQAMTTRIHAYLMSLIDGKRSLKDMARLMEAERLMPAQEAEAALRGFLTKMYDEANRAG